MGFNLNDYETVEDRLARFWADHPNGRIATAMMNYDGDTCVFRAEIYFDADPGTANRCRVRRRNPRLQPGQQNIIRGKL
jgi:hypothetical protein